MALDQVLCLVLIFCTLARVELAQGNECDPNDLSNLENGMVTFDSVALGSVATYTCDRPYRLVGQPTRTCVRNGDNTVWNGQTPTCELILCPQLSLVNAMIIMTSNVVGSQAFYYCDAGFQLNGLAIRECTTSGEWSGAEPTCTRQQCEAFMPDRIFLREDAIFTAEIGPSANPRGYTGITGRPGWNISWYIDGNLVPELVVERNRTYTFIVYGGNDPTDDVNYHPFYITSSESGGRLYNTPDQRMDEVVFAGFDDNDQVTAVGALCEYLETATTSENIHITCGFYNDYINSLELFCFNISQSGILIWTPDENTPDLVYYQSASYVNLGHAIQIINQNDPAPPRIPHPSSPTTPVVTPTIATPTVPTVVISVQTDGTSSSLKLSRFTGWITILVLALFAPLAF